MTLEICRKWVLMPFLYIEKLVRLETVFFLNSLGVSQVILTFVLLFQAVVVSFSDVSTFFATRDFFPLNWRFLEDSANIRIISIVFIVFLFLLLTSFDRARKAKEISEVAEIIRDYVHPKLEDDLNRFKLDFCKKFNINEEVYAYIFIPVRRNFARWHFRPISCSKNITNREERCNRIKFRLHESIIGYQFLNRSGTPVDSWIFPILSGSNEPDIYLPASRRNIAAMGRGIKQVLLTYSYYEGFVVGILAMTIMGDISFAEQDAADASSLWILDNEKPLRLIWRQKNNAWG